MFTIRFPTVNYRPDLAITIRNNVDGWTEDIPGAYDNDEWRFVLDEDRYPAGMVFKFVLERTYWMIGPNLFLQPVAGGDYPFTEDLVRFPPIAELVVESGYLQTLFFKPNLDENHQYDVIVIGSGIGGGVLADQLSDLGVDVLVLEAGSYLFPSHVANLPRQHQVGKFDKHIWGLFDEFKVQNYVNGSGSQYFGGQAFNLGGRSVFWGGLLIAAGNFSIAAHGSLGMPAFYSGLILIVLGTGLLKPNVSTIVGELYPEVSLVPPEIFHQRDLDPATDVFLVAAHAYLWMTGQPAHGRGTGYPTACRYCDYRRYRRQPDCPYDGGDFRQRLDRHAGVYLSGRLHLVLSR